MNHNTRQANMIAAGVVVLVGLFFTIFSVPIYRKGVGGGPGAGVFPFWIGLLLTVFGVVYLVSTLRSKLPEKLVIGAGEEKGSLVWAGLLIVAYVGLMPYLGFALGTFLFMAAHLRISGGYKWVFSIVLSLVTAVLCTYVFRVSLNIGLPVGFVGW
jgi:putative tricarboxylic transport membrane protein